MVVSSNHVIMLSTVKSWAPSGVDSLSRSSVPGAISSTGTALAAASASVGVCRVLAAAGRSVAAAGRCCACSGPGSGSCQLAIDDSRPRGRTVASELRTTPEDRSCDPGSAATAPTGSADEKT